MDPLVLGLAAFSAACFLAFALWPQAKAGLEVDREAFNCQPKSRSRKLCLSQSLASTTTARNGSCGRGATARRTAN
jgi:hypothetical protein